MSIPNYLYALANHKGPAAVNAGGMTIPVKIGNINHHSAYMQSDVCTFECLVVNEDQIKIEDASVRRYLATAATPYHRYGKVKPFSIRDVKFGNTTTVRWADGSKTAIICPKGDVYSEEYSLALCFTLKRLGIAKVIFDDPVTVVLWEDGVKTMIRCQEGDVYSKEEGLFLCITKKSLGNKGNFNNVFHKWIPEKEEKFAYAGTVDFSDNPLFAEAVAVANKAMEDISRVLRGIPKEEEPEKVDGCSYCRGAERTDETFEVHTPSGAVLDAKFNWCPVCGRELPKREEA